MTPKKIAQINVKRLMLRDGINKAQIARDFGFSLQNAAAMVERKTGITEKNVKRLCEKYGWDESEIYKDIDTIGKTKDVNEILFDLLTQLDKEDKKTIARLMVRMLNKPRIAILITQQILEHIDR